ncbi:hypothetical protein B0H65DRAFT_474357 [Neurospora tetraspora]|uniref:Uncharacterized protein n=1 Tax=Neurospora tetraspora TaxID=94610 RepID=A0AAE0JC95_9PEZI|nr:hypothetical protein B0H65DRAFT_474357 [Neurospora tetraspora]
MKLKEFLARRSSAPSHMNPQFMSDEYMNRRRSFGRGGAGNIRMFSSFLFSLSSSFFLIHCCKLHSTSTVLK